MWVELILTIIVLSLIVKISTRKDRNSSNFWKERGIFSINISNIASSWELVLGTKTMEDIDRKLYHEMGENKFCGIIEANRPILIVKDLDLVKHILIKDFDHFADRQILFAQSKLKSLLKMLPTLEGAEWRGTRVAMSPAFTTGKMRRIMETFNSCGREWISYTKAMAKEGLVDIKESAGRYSLDVIASGVLGLKAGSIQDPNSPFLKHVKKFGDTSLSSVIKQSLAMRFPSLFRLLNIDVMNEEMVKFFDNVFMEALTARESGRNPARNDFLQLFIEARKGVVKSDGSDELSIFEKEAELKKETIKPQYLQYDDIAKGQSLIFFFAGYHGITMTVAYAIHALAHFPKIQEKIRKELDGKVDSEKGIGYDNLNTLTYMDMLVTEIYRFYPITPRLTRLCTKDYERPDIGLKIPKGTSVEIPMTMIHNDPKYYPNPEKFDPEHFSAENKSKRSSYTLLSFGHGPRNCIGMRFALVEVKTTIAHIVHNFLIEPHVGTPFPLKTKLVGHGLHIVGPVKVKLIPRD